LSQLITLDVIDADGAVREAAEAAGATRGDFLRKTGIAGAGFVAGGVLFNGFMSPAEAAISTRKASVKNDVKILNYALTLEFLEAAFYNQAVANGALTDPVVKRFAEVVSQHENAHVTFLKKALGRAAIKSPTFDFKDTVTNQDKFKQTAQVLEDTGVAAYAGQGPNIKQRPVVVAALSVHSVEARHAAWIRFINAGGTPTDTAALPAPVSFDKALSDKKVLAAVGGTGFITG
jgi:hypothetical protein